MGWRARIGIVYPADSDGDDDYWNFAPEGVTLHISRNAADTEGDPVASAMAQFDDGAIETACRLLQPIHPHAVAYACCSGSFIRGPQGDHRIITAMEQATGCRATTGMSGCVAALRALGVRRIAVVTPYPESKNRRLRDHLEAEGFRISSFKTLELPDGIWNFCRRAGMTVSTLLGNDMAYRLGRAADVPEAEAVLIACTSFRTGEMIAALEEDVAKPVVTANQAVIWHALQLGGIRARLPRRGRLFDSSLPHTALLATSQMPTGV
jgi:maleate isomerase